MKLAVIFAIIQMSLGIFLKGMNSLHFRNRLDFFFEFIPQFLLLFALFGWMDILIIGKWTNKKNIENITL
jgi:V-type H+-transporting ATPase subunit a